MTPKRKGPGHLAPGPDQMTRAATTRATACMRIEFMKVTSEELAACELAATLLRCADVAADSTLGEQLPETGWKRQVGLLKLVLAIIEDEGWVRTGKTDRQQGAWMRVEDQPSGTRGMTRAA